MIWWRKRNKEKEQREHRQEIEAATRKIDELDYRARKLKQDNHFIVDIKRTLGAQ